VVDADIAGFFDSIRPEVLGAALAERVSDRRMRKLIMGWLKAGVLAGETLLHPQAGTPQGGVASPLLANVVLHRLDRAWQARHRRLGVLVRYCDDLIILCPTKERAEAALAVLTKLLADLGLTLATAKTHLVDLQAGSGFDFLGFQHRRVESFTRRGRYFCARWPSTRAVRAAKQRIRERTDRRWLLLPAEDIVRDLNRFLVGWRSYFRHGNSTTVFHDLDRFVTDRMARFIANKHGYRGRNYGLLVLMGHDYLGLQRLVGSVRHGTVHAVR
jgi:RNA-directed DNA polymerase